MQISLKHNRTSSGSSPLDRFSQSGISIIPFNFIHSIINYQYTDSYRTMSKVSNHSFIKLGGRPDSKISQARSKVTIVSNPSAPLRLSEIASSVSSALRLDLKFCDICLERKPNAEFGTFCNCNHLFCKDCLSTYLSSKIFVNEIDIKCLSEECNEKVNQHSAIFLQMPENLKERYFKMKQNRKIMANPLLSHCPTPGCTFILQRADRNAAFHCPHCKTNFCPVCLLPQHVGECDSFAQLYLKNNYRYKKCPNCRMVVEKWQGCDHMTCTCGYQFCYNCGGRWTPSHNCWLYEQLNVDQPVTHSRRILNHILLPFAFVLGFVLVIVLFVLAEVVLVTIVPFFAAYQLAKQCNCGCVCGLLSGALLYPLILLCVVVYGQTLMAGWVLGWCDFLGRIISYLKR